MNNIQHLSSKKAQIEELAIVWPQKVWLQSLLLKYVSFVKKYSLHDNVVSALGVTHCDLPTKNADYAHGSKQPYAKLS